MAVELRVEGAEKFGAVAKTLKQIGDKELNRELYRGINRAVKPLREAVKEGAPRYLPRRYAFELAKSLKVRTRRRAGRNPSIRLVGSAKTPGGKDRDLASLNRGRLRHPLYGNRGYWYDQDVSPKWWDEPLFDNVKPVRAEIVKVLDEVARKAARKY